MVIARVRGWIRRDPGGALVALAVLLAALLYVPTIGRGLVNHDDPWLVRDNWLLRRPSLHTLHAIWFDTSQTTRFLLGAEYLPVRDLTALADRAVWGTWYGGDHLVNVALYLASIGVWAGALFAFGVPRRIVGVAALLWAVMPAHAESVAWVSERKGLLAMALTGLAAYAYARFRTRADADAKSASGVGWLALAAIAGVASVWSKAPAAFALASLAPLEWYLPARRISWTRSLVGLAVIGFTALLAFIPVVLVARSMAVVAGADAAPAGKLVMAAGLHGHYLAVSAGLVHDAVSYPIASLGPSTVELAAGIGGVVALLALLGWPAWLRRSRRADAGTHAHVAAAGAALWVLGVLPYTRLVLPLRSVLVADRYLLFPTLGGALVIAAAIDRIAKPRLRALVTAAIVLAFVPRALDASVPWADSRALWERATASNPHDGDAWSMLAEARSDAGDAKGARAAIESGLRLAPIARLHLRAAVLWLAAGDRPRGEAEMLVAAQAGEYRAMANLALLLDGDGRPADGLAWAQRAVTAAPLYVAGHRALGKLALTLGDLPTALAAFERAIALSPEPQNEFNLGLVLHALHRDAEARPHLEACLADPRLGPRARAVLAQLAPL